MTETGAQQETAVSCEMLVPSLSPSVTGDLGDGAARLVRGIYVSDVGIGTDGASEPEPIKGEGGEKAADSGVKAGV
ncbi:hypothetical protein NDU88_001723 [Pleurodeles waltl]|uniref:Uncharacterized protein n=1 Tax=Pleurodeles waltl TaxID=8319 RepID=A0AAV7WN53_PLEWA|nr:hypothetical protein NDU88_001723 [Pleurodeles waltl]